jgi:hypothetical protein
MMIRKIVIVLILLTFIPISLFSQEEQEKQDPWKPINYFIGSWKGNEGTGPETGKGDRTYQYILQDRFIHFKNKSVFEETEKRPQGEVHDDMGIFSYDKNRDILVLRQFHVEGFINQYVMDSLSTDQTYMEFVTESIENGFPGLKARLRYHILNENEFEEAFDLSSSGNEYKCYIENHWRRVD